MTTNFFRAIPLSLLAVFGAASLMAAPKVFDVRDAGAKGDGKTLDTAAIQRALDDCGNAGGGTVRFPAGTYLSKPIFLRSKTILELEKGATLRATDNEADFADPAKPGAWRAFIGFVNGRKLSDIAIMGPGTIDGSGERWWGPAREAKRTNTVNPGYTLPRPKMIVLKECQNVWVTHVTLINSPCFHLVPTDCENVTIDDVTITAPADSPNTDAIDPSASRHVRITHCRLDVGDDNVAIKAGPAASGHKPTCEDITVTDCTFLHGHGMSIGSETAGGVRNVTVRHCTFQDTENGLRIKSPRGKGGTVENISYEDITMQNVDPAILFTCYYPKIPKSDTSQPVTATTPVFRNIRISNLTATCPRAAGVIVGLPESPVSDVVLENVQIAAQEGLSIRNAQGIQLKQAQVATSKGPEFIVENAHVDGLASGNK
jgi:polygalacturonase